MDFGEIGKRIKDLRLEKKLSLEKFSEITNIDKSMLSRYENGKNCKSGMQLFNIAQIASALSTSIDYLVYGNGPRKVEYEKRKETFGELFVKSFSFLCKNFSCEIRNYQSENDLAYYNYFYMPLCMTEHGAYDTYNSSIQKIINLYLNDIDYNSKSFKAYEKEFLNDIAKKVSEEHGEE